MLTKRQFEVLLLVVEGNGYKAVSSRLNITVRTVKWHVITIYENIGIKTGERSNVKLGLWWARAGAPETWGEYLQFEGRELDRQERNAGRVVQLRRRSA